MLRKIKVLFLFVLVLIVPLAFSSCKKKPDDTTNKPPINEPVDPNTPGGDKEPDEPDDPIDEDTYYTVNVSYSLPEKYEFLLDSSKNNVVNTNSKFLIDEAVVSSDLEPYFLGYYVNNIKLDNLEISGSEDEVIEVVGKFNLSDMKNYYATDGITYSFDTESGEAKIVSCEKDVENIIIPCYAYSDEDETFYQVTAIDDYAFTGEKNGNLRTILTYATQLDFGDYCFYNSPIENIDLSVAVSVGDYAFAGSNLSEIKTSAFLISLGERCFSDMINLTSVDLEYSTFLYSLPEGAFYGATALNSVKISRSIASIFGYAFYNCTSLSDISFITTDKLNTIESFAFYGCNLKNLTIPENITNINVNAFSDCGIEQINLYWLYFSQNYLYNFLDYFSGADETVKSICLLGSNIEEIYADYFSGLTALEYFSMGTNPINLISDYAFSGCENLSEIKFPDDTYSTGTFNKLAFEDTAWYKNLNELIIIDGSLFFVPNNILNQTGELILNDFTNQSIEIISAYALSGAVAEIITIPSSVKSILNYALSSCANLTQVKFEENSALEEIGDYAFYSCTKLSNVNLGNCENLTQIGEGAFKQCGSIELLNLPNSVTEIGASAFAFTSVGAFEIDNSVYKSIDGVLYKIDADANPVELVAYPSANGRSVYVLPETVTTLSEFSFTYAYCYLLIYKDISTISASNAIAMSQNFSILYAGNASSSNDDFYNFTTYILLEDSTAYEITDSGLEILNEDALTSDYMFVLETSDNSIQSIYTIKKRASGNVITKIYSAS